MGLKKGEKREKERNLGNAFKFFDKMCGTEEMSSLFIGFFHGP